MFLVLDILNDWYVVYLLNVYYICMYVYFKCVVIIYFRGVCGCFGDGFDGVG